MTGDVLLKRASTKQQLTRENPPHKTERNKTHQQPVVRTVCDFRGEGHGGRAGVSGSACPRRLGRAQILAHALAVLSKINIEESVLADVEPLHGDF